MNFIKKWYIYQKERFPILAYSSYIFAIVFAVFCYNSYLLNSQWKDFKLLIGLFAVTFLQFLMVRIVDEFKDYEEDCKYRPYRPVPRGLISLKELKVLFIICIILQVSITFFMSKTLLITFIILGILWLFFAIMSKSFFMKKFLEKHILIEVALDELMMPILVIYLSSFFSNGDDLFTNSMQQLLPLLCMSYTISWIVEIARKVRCKEDEENGVKTYTAVFGIKGAMFILCILQWILFILHTIILGKERIIITMALFVIVSTLDLLFAIKQNKVYSKLVELIANIHVLIVYFSLILLIL